MGKRDNSSVDYYHVGLTFLVSFLAWPTTYIANNSFRAAGENMRSLVMMVVGFLLLGAVVYGTKKASKVKDWMYYGVTLFAFSCMIDLIISLEFMEYIHNFMSEYVSFGETYLFCPWGSAIAMFDGIGFYVMYLLIAFQISNGWSWRSTGIYWASGILNSMIVLLGGVFVGKHYPTFCTFLNVPYVFLPIFGLKRALVDECRSEWKTNIKTGIVCRLADILLIVAHLASIWIMLMKGLGALGSSAYLVVQIVKHEPSLYLNDPAPYAAIQMLIYLFYLVPIQSVSLIYLFKSAKPQFLWESTLVHAGIVLQAQFSYIWLALDPQTPAQFQSHWNDATFWLLNLVVLIVPHLMLYRLSFHRHNSRKETKATTGKKH